VYRILNHRSCAGQTSDHQVSTQIRASRFLSTISRHLFFAGLMFILSFLLSEPVHAYPGINAGRELFSSHVSGEYLCPRLMMRRVPGDCPPYGPGAREVRVEYLRTRLPDPLPTLEIEEIEAEDDAVTSYSFAYVRPLPAASYRHPEEASVGMPAVREFLSGDNWVSVMGSVEYGGQLWYEINPNEYILADHLSFTAPSRFSGVVLSEQPAYPFGWINRQVIPSVTPGGARNGEVTLNRYDRITIYAQESLGAELWYMVGTDQWVEQSFTSRVDVDPPPEGVGPNEKWIEINTYEQTVAAYQGTRMVFATLTSTGRPSTWTPNGLTRIWGKYTTTPMQNRDVTPGSPAWYYLEDVEWTQYFNGAYALHAAYWHNAFGFTRSHGCVNLALRDARWLFDWTTPPVPSDTRVVLSGSVEAGTWVWVHKTPPFPSSAAAQ
jgi:lipoprotein-anchoring transpeptidase ErfK/SrfK